MWLYLVLDPFLRFYLYNVTCQVGYFAKLFLKFGDVRNNKGRGDRDGAREKQSGRGSPNPFLARLFNKTAASCCVFQNNEKSVHRLLAIVQHDNIYTLNSGIISWTVSTTLKRKCHISKTSPATAKPIELTQLIIQIDHRKSGLP